MVALKKDHLNFFTMIIHQFPHLTMSMTLQVERIALRRDGKINWFCENLKVVKFAELPFTCDHHLVTSRYLSLASCGRV